MTVELTHPLLTQRPSDPRRPQLMAALALAEHLVSLGEPVPYTVTIRTPYRGEAEARLFVPQNMSALFAYQERFGGVLHQELRPASGTEPVHLYAELKGRVFDGPFSVWTTVDLSEQGLAEWFVRENGDPADWSALTKLRYVSMRPGVAA